jgi:hypothetical protein
MEAYRIVALVILSGVHGLKEDELDFIINYDIKYRMGADDD